ncbi:hypothetical protein ACFQLX_25210 [Streptomyces polyrhachis]|uniref:Uncharacterized protein n=1 Tax=Streptomyces polyrhachis TaxID=1282885 RepID=A0ABW2GL17_9ACTN
MTATTRTRPVTGPLHTRLRWWGVALPAAMFTALLYALGSPAGAASSEEPLLRLLAWLADALSALR